MSAKRHNRKRKLRPETKPVEQSVFRVETEAREREPSRYRRNWRALLAQGVFRRKARFPRVLLWRALRGKSLLPIPGRKPEPTGAVILDTRLLPPVR